MMLAGGSVAGIFALLLVLSNNRRRRDAAEKQVAEVEMKALREQMNPHFIFNALNSINNFILKKDVGAASDYLHEPKNLSSIVITSK